MLVADENWYQIYTRSNAEKKLYEKIIALGATAFLPLRKVRKQWSDRIKTIEEPAFKSYIFAKLSVAQMRMVERLSEFCYFVSYGSRSKSGIQRYGKFFPAISDHDIDTIANVLAAFPSTELLDKSKLAKGTMVQINQDSLKGYQATLLADPKGNKVAIDIKGLEQSLVMTVPVALLTVVS